MVGPAIVAGPVTGDSIRNDVRATPDYGKGTNDLGDIAPGGGRNAHRKAKVPEANFSAE